MTSLDCGKSDLFYHSVDVYLLQAVNTHVKKVLIRLKDAQADHHNRLQTLDSYIIKKKNNHLPPSY